MSTTEEALVEALNETRAMARELAICTGFLLAQARDFDLLDDEAANGGQTALLCWHRFDLRLTELLEAVGS